MTCRKDPQHPTPVITAIVLAAGQSRRMGVQKVLLPYGPKTVIEHIVEALRQGGADEIIAVTGHEGARVAAAVRATGVRVAFNPAYLEGMLSSVRCGVRAACAETKGFVVALGDQPSIRGQVVQSIISAFRSRGEDTPTIVVPTHNGQRGHPLLFSGHFREAVLRDFDDVGLRGLLAANLHAIEQIPIAESGILRDMDDPKQYANELKARDAACEAAKTSNAGRMPKCE